MKISKLVKAMNETTKPNKPSKNFWHRAHRRDPGLLDDPMVGKAIDDVGFTALQWISHSDKLTHEDLLKIINNPYAAKKTKVGYTPLHILSGHGHKEVKSHPGFKTLKNHNAIQGKHQTPAEIFGAFEKNKP